MSGNNIQAFKPTISKPAKALLNILHGNTKGAELPLKTIVIGNKISNSVLNKFVEKFQEKAYGSDGDLIRIILMLDKLVEDQHLSNEVLEEINENPKILDKIWKEEKNGTK